MPKLKKSDRAARAVAPTVAKRDRPRVVERATSRVSAQTSVDFQRAVRKK